MPILTTKDGSHSLLSLQFNATYHSPFGAVSETDHVFLGAGLRYLARTQKNIRILEAGFGTGLNAFMTWMEAERTGLVVEYTGVELHPVDLETASALNYAAVLGAPDRHPDFLKLHRAEWGQILRLSENFTFAKLLQPIQAVEQEDAFDLVYFDAFDPSVQPELWTLEVFVNLFRSMHPGGILVTYCSQGAFRRNLRQAGFWVEKLPGTLGKWEITRGHKKRLLP
jgi:tRNA U34 5-methylaminomethyl-2-thiouridine-forming methyltransferase MnmC